MSDDVFGVIGRVVASLGGAALILAALSSFVSKVWLNRILEKDRARYQLEFEALRNQQQQHIERLRVELDSTQRRLQAQIDRTVFVTKVHFETEFRAMQVIWAKVVKLRGTMSSVRPTFSTAPSDDTPEKAQERLFNRVKAFSAALDEAKDAIFENEPFITEDLYAELYDRFLLAAQAEETSVRVHRQETDPKWYEKGEKNVGDLVASARRAAALIRKRVSELSVLGD